MKISTSPQKVSTPPGLERVPEEKPADFPNITRARMWQRARWAKQAAMTMRHSPPKQHSYARLQTGLSMLKQMNRQMTGGS